MKPIKVIEATTKDMESLDNKELVMAIIAIQHLSNENIFESGANALVTTVSTVSGVLLDSLFNKVVFATLSIAFAARLVMDINDHHKINRCKKVLVDELVKRFETPQMAYLEISELISSVTREEIIEYLNNIGCEINVK